MSSEMSQTLTAQSRLPEMTVWPSLNDIREVTVSEWPWNLRMSFHDCKSHNRISGVVPSEAEIKKFCCLMLRFLR
mgnify:CR=1 FL=1